MVTTPAAKLLSSIGFTPDYESGGQRFESFRARQLTDCYGEPFSVRRTLLGSSVKSCGPYADPAGSIWPDAAADQLGLFLIRGGEDGAKGLQETLWLDKYSGNNCAES
jgi:hypothetical protein